jgi:hypothetical protein
MRTPALKSIASWSFPRTDVRWPCGQRGGSSGVPLVRNWRRCLGAVALVLALQAQALTNAPAADEHVDEYQVKAAVLYNIAKFVDWPADAFADAATPLVICILGVDPFGTILDDTLKGHMVGKRPVLAKRITDVTSGCHLLFVANSERRRLPSIFDRVRRTSMLTVGEAEGFADQGGMIGLATDGNRVRFDINVEAVDGARLKLSARLMALASAVRRPGETGR